MRDMTGSETSFEWFFVGYIEAMFFTLTDDGGNSVWHVDADWLDISPTTLAQAARDCGQFFYMHHRLFLQKEAWVGKAKTIGATGEQHRARSAGHDFWMTRNGHGCGFWDGDWLESIGEALSRGSKAFGETWILWDADEKKVTS